MSLTIDQAKAAGLLAAEIEAVQGAITQLHAAIDAKATSSEFSANVTIGGSGTIMHAPIPMDAQATAGVFAQVIAAYQTMLDELNAQLAAIAA